MPSRPRSSPFHAAAFLALVGLAWGGSARAQEPAQEPAAAADEEGLDRRRILTLEDGRILRARSARLEGVWNVRERNGWVPVEGAVRTVRLEREVLAQARRMATEVGRDDHGRRAELARWMASQGLHAEARLELDRVLRRSPEDPAALRVIRETNIELDRPMGDGLVANLTAILRAGAGGTPAEREIAARRLADLGPRVDLGEVVRAELVGSNSLRRAFAALATRRIFPGRMLEPLADRAVLDGTGAVRDEAARGLRDAATPAVLGPLVRALGSNFSSVRANAAEALGVVAQPAAVEPLATHLEWLAQGGGVATTGHRAALMIGFQTAYVMDYDIEIAQAASIADPVAAIQDSGVVLDVRAQVQRSIEVELRAVVSSLGSLTGRTERDPNEWLRWWQANREEWLSKRFLTPAKPETSGR